MTPRKITDAPPGKTIGPEYSTISPFSYGCKWLLLIHPEGFFGLYTGDGVFQRLLPSIISTSSRPRWSRTDPNVITFLLINTLIQYNIVTLGSISLHEFTEYTSIDDMGEADTSLDGNHRVLCGVLPSGQQEIFVYQLSTGSKGKVYPTRPFDGLKITGSNEIIISRADGIWVLSDTQRQLTTVDGHACVGRDTNGDDILLWTNSNENPITLPNYPNGVVKIRIADGRQTGLLSLPWSDAVDITMPQDGNSCFISTYGGKEASGKIYEVALDGTWDKLLLDGINHDVVSYNGQPKASVSRDGSGIVWAAIEQDQVTVNTWIASIGQLPSISTRVTEDPFAGYKQVPLGAFRGKPYILVLRPDGTFTEYMQE